MSAYGFEKFNGYTKKQVVSFVRTKLAIDFKWAKAALLLIYDNQTDREKNNSLSDGDNGIGFDKFHAPLLSSIVKKIRQNHKITTDDIMHIKKVMPHYAIQAIKFCDRKLMEKHLNLYYGNKSTINAEAFTPTIELNF